MKSFGSTLSQYRLSYSIYVGGGLKIRKEKTQISVFNLFSYHSLLTFVRLQSKIITFLFSTTNFHRANIYIS